MRLFLDDRRPSPAPDFVLCTTAEEAKDALSADEYDLVSLDYDLGPFADTGLDVLKWMDENGVRPARINIHSTHFFGKGEMEDYARAHFPHTLVTALDARGL